MRLLLETNRENRMNLNVVRRPGCLSMSSVEEPRSDDVNPNSTSVVPSSAIIRIWKRRFKHMAGRRHIEWHLRNREEIARVVAQLTLGTREAVGVGSPPTKL